tara:strand:+ start:2547 stop:3824 length:1278 start_codon:yes stop_codon:yes gene_type:complete
MKKTDQILTLLLMVLAFVQPVLGVFSSKAMTVMMILAAVPGCRMVWQRRGEFGDWRQLVLPGVPFILWAGVSLIWSVDPDRSQSTLLSFLALVGVAVLLFWLSRCSRGYEADRIMAGLAAGFLVALLVMLFEVLSAYQLTRLARGLSWSEIINIGFGGINIASFLKNGVTISALAVWPAAAWLWMRGQRFAAVTGIILLTVIVVRTEHGTALLALAGGGICGMAGLLLPTVFPRLLVILGAGWLLLAPPVLQVVVDQVDLSAESGNTTKIPASMIGRLVIWDFVLEKIAERPVAGWGLGTSRSVPGGDEKVDVTYLTSENEERVLFTDFRLPLHPHNQILQLWLELGGVGVVCLALSFVLLAWRMAGRASSGIVSAAHSAGLTAAMVFANSSFGLWQNWWIGLLALTMLWHGLLQKFAAGDDIPA